MTLKGGTAAGSNAGRPADEAPNGPTAEQAQRRDAIGAGACVFALDAVLRDTRPFAYTAMSHNVYLLAYSAVLLGTHPCAYSVIARIYLIVLQ